MSFYPCGRSDKNESAETTNQSWDEGMSRSLDRHESVAAIEARLARLR
jgi:hypothetical protein